MGTPWWQNHPAMQLPGVVRPEALTSAHPLLVGGSPGTTGTMSLYRALVMLGISVVHYSRTYNATTGRESTTYGQTPPGGPVPLLRPLFAADTHPAPPVDLAKARSLDLRFLAATDALLDTPTMEIFFEVLASFPNARVVLTLRDPLEWAASRRERHPTDRSPLFHLLGFEAPLGALSDAQAAAALALWHRVVSASVAPDRLLVLDLFHTPSDELWRQLCTFLDRSLPVAKDGPSLPPFPHERYGDDVRRFVADVHGVRRGSGWLQRHPG